MKINIIQGLATEAVFLREKRDKYETNRAIKAFGLWTLFRNETSSGFIHNSTKNWDRLEELTKVSIKTLHRWAKEAEKLKLIEAVHEKNHCGKWSIFGWRIKSIYQVSEIYLLDPKKQYEIEYDITNPKITIEYILKALEIDENQAKQQRAFEHKQRLNPKVNRAIMIEAENLNLPATGNLSAKELKFYQQQTFKHGGSHSITYDSIQNVVNPDFQRSAKRLAIAHRMKNAQSIVYLKRALTKRGLATIQRREPIVCSYAQDPALQGPRGSKKHSYRRYDQKNQTATWYLPDQITTLIPYTKKKTENPRPA